MLYKLNNQVSLHIINIPEVDRFRLFNYCKLKFNQYLPKFNSIESNIIIQFLVNSLYILKNGLNIETDKDELEVFLNQISMNNDRNFLAIVNLVLPYLDDKNDNFNQNNITSFTTAVSELNSDNTAKYCNFIFDHNFIKKVECIEEKNIKRFKVNATNELFSSDEVNDITSLYYNSIFYFILDIFNKIRYKFYINWINSFPLTIETYKETKLYNSSFNFNSESNLIEFNDYPLNFPNFFQNLNISGDELINIDKITSITGSTNSEVESLIKQSNNIIKDYKGINLEDIYNTIANDYYFSIKRNKWLFFEFGDNNNINILIYMLNNIFDINTIIDEKSWYMLNSEQKFNFESNWVKMKEAIKNKIFFKYDYDVLKNIFVSLVSYFEIHYKNIVQLIQKDKTFNNKNLIHDLNEDDDEDMFDISVDDNVKVKKKNLNVQDYLIAISNVSTEHIYNFLYDEINIIKNTPYNFLLFEDNKLINKVYNKIDLSNPDSYELTPKNYYNYSKSLIYKNFNQIYKDDGILLFSNLWDGLSIEDRYIITLRLNQSDTQNWFRITSVLRKTGYSSNINQYQTIIYNKIRSQIVDLTFENLIRKGCISKFEYNPTISDGTILTDDYETKNKRLAENMKNDVLPSSRITEFENAYYYVNNKKYKDQSLISLDYKGKPLKCNYVEYVSKYALTAGDTWNTFYAVDWVSQIDFYMKFLNQRVMYVTGSTGQGKSTQVPKLYLYGLKSFLYKNNGKILCTVPRIDPVLENATQISGSMGVPIKHYNDDFKEEVRTLEGIVQYKYSTNNHINVNNQYYLRILTDGSLIMTLRQNPLLKEKKNIDGQLQFTRNSKISSNNFCDVVMVDEAHEHNKNMDLILTLMKYSLFYNNDIKLSIISATMEADEPIFRKFYRYMDDNMMFPLNTYNLNYGVDRNLIDRRYHISPPGMTTQHTVNEFYENSNLEDTYEANELLAIEKVKNILMSTTYGEILLFSVTVSKISQLVERLNNEMPPNCIAIPYHGKMSERYKAVAKKAHINIKKLTIDRRDIDNVFNNRLKEINARKVNPGTYNRACIIATNAAEASLTIFSLKFVVDIGYQFTVKYNYDTKDDDLLTEKITEASRVQRKGRVGRVSDGTVYHMYPKGSREPVKAAYDISISDFSENFKDLLATNNDSNNEIISTNIIYKLLSFKTLTESEKRSLNSTAKIIYDQYKLSFENYRDDGTCGFIDYVFNIMNLENIYDYYFPTYFTGYSSSNLLDISGHFYIINPLEQIINRDIVTGNLIDDQGNEKNIEDSDIKKIYERAEAKSDLVKLSDDNIIYKSGLANEFENIQAELRNYDNVYSKIMSLAFLMNNSDDGKLILAITFIFELLENIQYDISKLISSNQGLNPFFFKDKETIVKNSSKFYYDNKVNNSELEFFYKIFLEITGFVDINIFTNKINDEASDISEKLVKFYIGKNLNVDTISNFCKLYSLDSKLYDEIIKLILKGNTSVEGLKEDNTSLLNRNLIQNYIKENNSLKEYCKIKDLNFELVSKSFCNSLSNFIVYHNKLTEKKFNNSIDNLNSLTDINVPDDDFSKIKLICLYCYSNNIFYQKEGIFYRLLSSDILRLNASLLKNISNFAFFIKQDSLNNNAMQVISSTSKEEILNTVPHIIRYIDDKSKSEINYKNIQENIHLITKKFSNVENKKNMQIDKNISNTYMEQIIAKPEILNKVGGMYYNIGPIQKIMKLKIDSLKKLPELMEYVKKSTAILDEYQYAYVISYNRDVVGFFLVKEIAYRTVFIYKVFDDVNSYHKLYNKLRRSGYIIYYYKKN